MIISFSRYWIFSVPSNAAHSWAVRNEHNQLLYIRNTAVPRNFVPGRPVMMQVSDFITLPDSWAVYVLGTGAGFAPRSRGQHDGLATGQPLQSGTPPAQVNRFDSLLALRPRSKSTPRCRDE